MRKIKLDKQYFRLAVYAFCTLAALIVFDKVLGNMPGLSGAIHRGASFLFRVLAPFLVGAVIAYFLNGGVMFVERQFSRIKAFRRHKGGLRLLSVFVVYIIVVGVIVWIVAFLVPEIVSSIVNLIDRTSDIVRNLDVDSLPISINLNGTFQEFLDTVNETFATNFTVDSIINTALAPMLAMLAALPQFATTIINGLIGLANGTLNFLLGLIIAFYMLCEKENVTNFCAKVVTIIFKRRRANKLIDFASDSSKIFAGFVVGKSIDSFIIGVIFFLTATIMKLPYPMLLALIVGVTNMIPYFGPFIGAAPVIVIVLLQNPILSLWTAIAILIIQQFDGIILGPKILGDQVGIKPMGVIFAILLGGAIFGIPGMFFGVPVYAVISKLISNMVDTRYDRKTEIYRAEDEQEPVIISETPTDGTEWL